MDAAQYQALVEARVFKPKSLVEALDNRKRRALLPADGNLVIIASDHTARGKLALDGNPVAMANRFVLLQRLTQALSVPEVDGVLASADILEELAWLGALEGKLAIGTMNRGGIIGATWEIDDRLTSFDSEHVKSRGLDGGKTLLRIDLQDHATPRTLEKVAQLTSELADQKILAMIEPLPYIKNEKGLSVLDKSHEAMVTTVAIASGIGTSSAYTWLKIPTSNRMAEVAGATSLPILMLGGEPSSDPSGIEKLWAAGMEVSNVRGIVAGRTLLYPKDEDAIKAAESAVKIVHPDLVAKRG
jgi:hypothetical protein